MDRRATSPDSTSSTLSCIAVAPSLGSSARSSVGASSSNSTPPTSSGDSASIRSDAIKTDAPAENHQLEQTPERKDEKEGMSRRPSRRSRKSVPTYNVKMLAGTTLHTPTKYLQKHIDNVLHDEQAQEQLETEQQSREVTAEGEQSEQGMDIDDGDEKQAGRRSSRRARTSVPTYNLTMLAGSHVHIPTKYLEKHTQNVMRDREISGSTLAGDEDEGRDIASKKMDYDNAHSPTDQLTQELRDRIKYGKLPKSRKLLFEATHNAMTSASSTLGKRSRDMIESGKEKLQSLRSTRRTQSDSNLRVAARRKRLSTASAMELGDDPEDDSEYFTPKMKKWLGQGLYLGQHRDFDARLTESQNKAKRKAAGKKENKILPLPMFAGERLLSMPYVDGRNFKLPFDVFSPLPRKAKPEDWKKTSRNLFVGEAGTLWKKGKVQSDSYCECSPEDGCGEDCPNRYMFYECDSTNCHLGPELCTNRAFAELKRRAKGNRYDYGVEVLETKDRGFGVRAMRTFEPHQIIVEYAGEIITQDECDRRMNNEYKNNECYYLMTFHNKMIIDATRGSIARFVNHSCEPNCRMIKWTVAGEPRMALFAGESGIMTGEELTYDYNFDPFSSKNVQECRCGTRSCRGVLGPRPKDKPKFTPTALVAGAKRRIQDAFGGKDSRGSASPNKKRKVAEIARTAISRAKNTLMESQSSRAIRIAKEAADAKAKSASRAERLVRRSSSTVTLSSRRSIKLRKPSSSSLRTITSTTSRKTRTFLAKRSVTTARQAPSKRASPRKSDTARHLRDTPSPSSSMEDVDTPASSTRSAKATAKNEGPIGKIRAKKAQIEAEKVKPKPKARITYASKSTTSLNSKRSSSSLRQTTLPFKRITNVTPKARSDSSSSSESESDDDDEIDGAVREFAKLPSPTLKRPSTATSVRSAATSVKRNVVRSVRGPRRAAAVARMGLGLGVNGMGGLGEGGSGSTIRVIMGSDE